jgi:hypothetical protein
VFDVQIWLSASEKTIGKEERGKEFGLVQLSPD